MQQHPLSSSLPAAQPLTPAPGSASSEADMSEGGFGMLVDAINPLQHIPVVSSLYREATGDGISSVARIIGGGIFGGIPGLIASAATSLFDAVTGEDPGELAISALKDLGGTGSDSPFSADDGTALTGDRGQALAEVASALQDAPPPPPAAQADIGEALLASGNLNHYRDETLGLKDEGKREQYMASLNEIALNM